MNKYKIRWLQLMFLGGAVFGILQYGAQSVLVSLAVYIFLEIFVGNATLHRYWGHRSFEMSPNCEKFFMWLAHHIGVGSVLGWVGHHRWHHQHSDTELDLHSPTQNGIFHIFFGVWNANIPKSLISDLIKNKDLLFWHRNYFTYHSVVALALLVLSPWAFAFLYCLPNLLCLLSGYAIAILPHLSGTVRNSLLTELVTFGEGWHANHHNDPQTFKFHKWDVTGMAIEWFMKK